MNLNFYHQLTIKIKRFNIKNGIEMKLILKNTALLFGILLLFSCGKRKLHQTALKFNTSALALSGKANGGLILVGERDGSGEYFSTSISIPHDSSNQVEATLDLPEGKWDFFAMVWDDSSKMSINYFPPN